MSEIPTLIRNALVEVSREKTADHVILRLENGEDVKLEDLSIDSLDLFEVIMQIEDTLNIELDVDEVVAQGSVKGLADLVEQRSQGALANAKPTAS